MSTTTPLTLEQKIAKFRQVVAPAPKEGKNPHFKSNYATLNSILEVIQQPLQDCLLACWHTTEIRDGSLYVVTTLADTESQNKVCSMFPAFGTDPQKIGSAISYARRYNLLQILDIPTMDDDGNTSGNQKTPAIDYVNKIMRARSMTELSDIASKIPKEARTEEVKQAYETIKNSFN